MKKLLLLVFILFSAIVKAEVYGPFWMYDSSIIQPEGYSKVVVYSQPAFIASGIHIVNIETNEIIILSSSGSYSPIWYYYIPSGDYVVQSIYDNGVKVKVNGFEIEVGDQFHFSPISGSVVFVPDNE